MDPSLSRKIGVLRFVAVAAVVVFHAYPPGWHGGVVQESISLGLTRWALPFLGLISGYLFFRTFTPTTAGYLAKLRTRARTILLPFLVWSAVALLVAWGTGMPEFHGPITSPADALYHWLVRPCAAPLWFLQALMACIVVSPLVYLAVRALRYWVLVLALVWWVTGLRPDVLGPWISPIAFPPFIAGAAIAMLGVRPAWVKRSVPAWLLGTLAAGWLATSVLFAAFGVGLGPWLRTALLPAVVLGALTVWFGYEAARPLARRAPWLRTAAVFVAPLSFFVYATQQPQLRAVMLVLEEHLMGLPELADYLLAPLLTIAFSLFAAVVWRRVSPRTFSAVSGGRAAVRRATGGADGEHGPARGGDGVVTVPPPPRVTPALQGAGGAGGEEA